MVELGRYTCNYQPNPRASSYCWWLLCFFGRECFQYKGPGDRHLKTWASKAQTAETPRHDRWTNPVTQYNLSCSNDLTSLCWETWQLETFTMEYDGIYFLGMSLKYISVCSVSATQKIDVWTSSLDVCLCVFNRDGPHLHVCTFLITAEEWMCRIQMKRTEDIYLMAPCANACLIPARKYEKRFRGKRQACRVR